MSIRWAHARLFLTFPVFVVGFSCAVPTDPGLSVSIEASGIVNFGASATLTAVPSSGQAPFFFRWSLERVPDGVSASEILPEDVTTATLVTGPLETEDDFVFRVVITDSRNAHADAFFTVSVCPEGADCEGFAVIITGPDRMEFDTAARYSALASAVDVSYEWSIVSGSAVIDEPDDDETEITPDALGTVRFRVTVTDERTDETISSEKTVAVGPAIDATVPPLVIVGAPLTLEASVRPVNEGVVIEWEILEGEATLDDPTQATAIITTTSRGSVGIRLTASAVIDDETIVTTTRERDIVSILQAKPEVLVSTTEGDFTLALESVRAPRLTANFLQYVDEAFYDGILIHRVTPFDPGIGTTTAPQQILQSGAYVRDDGSLTEKEPTRDPVASDEGIGLSNAIVYSVAAALTGTAGAIPDPDSVQAEFFVNLSPLNAFLDLGGFPIFARVVDGTDVVDAISEVEVVESSIFSDSDGNPELSEPAEDVVFTSVRRLPLEPLDEENPFVSLEAPPLAVIGEPVALVANVQPLGDDVVFVWVIISGDATIDDPTSPTPNLTTASADTVVVELAVVAPTLDGAPNIFNRETEVVSIPDLTPRVVIATTLGAITLELDATASPITVANFLAYADDGFYEGTLIHRAASDPASGDPFVVQGGGFDPFPHDCNDADDDEGNDCPEKKETPRDPIPTERANGLSNGELYSVAMALSAGDPDSGTTQWFINLNESNSSLDDLEFTVFAKVVDGIDVVDTIVEVEVEANPLLGGEPSLPVVDIVIESVTRVDE